MVAKGSLLEAFLQGFRAGCRDIVLDSAFDETAALARTS